MFPLDGLTVVSLEQAIAAPFATRQLADLGARVIKVERPRSGDFARGYDTTVMGLASHFVWTNRSKESITLDLKHQASLAILKQLIARADVFVQNLAPGAAERLGLGAEQLLAKHPRLVACAISGYGDEGPYRNRKAYDLLVQCETGLVSITGTSEVPSKVGISIADIAAGMYAYTGILTALYQRERTGRGASLKVSMFDALAEWMGYPAYFTAYSGRQPPRTGANHATIAPYGPFPTADEKTVFIGIQNEREWRHFCESVLDRSELANDARFASNHARVANRDDLDAAIVASFRQMTASAIMDRLETAQIATARLNDVREFLQHPQLESRGRWREVGSPVGTLRSLLPPVIMEGADVAMKPVPGLGDQTRAILTELGLGRDAIAELERDAAV
ncbi:MAG: CoA transferase [Candidatus Dormibacteraeota bacterium]|uniref:CoA transferase n=2 Tax=Candidatus Dormibacteria TaxID=3126996 RepID=A0A934JWI2_9BACT|nr:CoA transferase [Candidatus Dormibacteraeota bacterium]MBJ7603970.1 CoA transferase [Candidatus Dormibacteraeota bacterium]MBJ7607151.1 CoA transferase [Candidatus Dormibacteraeota bacterium]